MSFQPPFFIFFALGASVMMISVLFAIGIERLDKLVLATSDAKRTPLQRSQRAVMQPIDLR
jgi:hypothetical protein